VFIRVHPWLKKLFQKSHFFGSGNQNFFRLSVKNNAPMNKFVKKLGCTERMTNCPFAIFSRNYIKDQKRSKKNIKDPLKKIK
jgi:hypothetical protein